MLSNIMGDVSPSMMSAVTPTRMLVAASVGLFSYLWWSLRRPAGMPPGPMAVPIIGNIALLRGGTRSVETIGNLAKQYGPVFSMYMGKR